MVGLPVWVSGVLAGGAGVNGAQAGFSGGPPTADGRNTCSRLRYERISAGGESDIAERDWHRRYWSQEQFREMLVTAGFDKITFVLPHGDQATPDAPVFVALARRGPLDNNST